MKKQDSTGKPHSKQNLNELRNHQTTDLLSILDNTNASIWTINKNYCLEFGNVEFQKECVNSLGRKIEAGESVFLETLNDSNKKEWIKYFDRALKGEKFSVERKHNNIEKWNTYHFSPIYNKSNDCIGVSVVAHDITDRILAEEAMQKSNIRFEEFVDMLPEAIFEMDTNFNLTYVNKYALNLFGYSKKDFERGLHGLDMLIPEHRELAKQNFQKRVKGKNPGTIEYSAQKKDGTIFPIHFHANTINTNGNLIGVRGIIVDLSEKTEALKKIKAHKEMLSLFVKHSPIYTFIKDVTSSESRVIYASDNFKDMIGTTGDEMLGKTMEELFSPDFAAKITADD